MPKLLLLSARGDPARLAGRVAALLDAALLLDAKLHFGALDEFSPVFYVAAACHVLLVARWFRGAPTAAGKPPRSAWRGALLGFLVLPVSYLPRALDSETPQYGNGVVTFGPEAVVALLAMLSLLPAILGAIWMRSVTKAVHAATADESEARRARLVRVLASGVCLVSAAIVWRQHGSGYSLRGLGPGGVFLLEPSLVNLRLLGWHLALACSTAFLLWPRGKLAPRLTIAMGVLAAVAYAAFARDSLRARYYSQWQVGTTLAPLERLGLTVPVDAARWVSYAPKLGGWPFTQPEAAYFVAWVALDPAQYRKFRQGPAPSSASLELLPAVADALLARDVQRKPGKNGAIEVQGYSPNDSIADGTSRASVNGQILLLAGALLTARDKALGSALGGSDI